MQYDTLTSTHNSRRDDAMQDMLGNIIYATVCCNVFMGIAYVMFWARVVQP